MFGKSQRTVSPVLTSVRVSLTIPLCVTSEDVLFATWTELLCGFKHFWDDVINVRHHVM